MPEPEEDDISVEELIEREAARVLYGSRIMDDYLPLNEAREDPVSFMEPSGDATRQQQEIMRQQQEIMRAHEEMMLRGMESFRGVDPARQSAETSIAFSAQRSVDRSLQHWEIRRGQPGYCQIDGSPDLTFPLVEFRERHGSVLIKFAVRHDQIRGGYGRSHLELGGREIFGEVIEQRLRRGVEGVDFTLLLHAERFVASSMPGEAARYVFTVSIAHYRRGDEDEEAYRVRLEQAGWFPHRFEGEHRSPIKQPALCNGCRYLHGHIYGGTKLVCGVHPYGNGEDCSDFEAK